MPRPLPLLPLDPGQVYRTRDLARWSRNPTRLAARLVERGSLRRLGWGLYMRPRASRFGDVPPSDEDLLRAFLVDAPFVVTGPPAWNALSLGATALHADTLVYNTKRSGAFRLGGRTFRLRRVAFPENPPAEWFVVDLLQHADEAGVSRPGGRGCRRASARRGAPRRRPSARHGRAVRPQVRARAPRCDAGGARIVSFVHEDPQFGDLLRVVAEKRRLALALVEKDYWVTHVLWALHAAGLRRVVQGWNLALEGVRPDRALLRGPRPQDRARDARRRCPASGPGRARARRPRPSAARPSSGWPRTCGCPAPRSGWTPSDPRRRRGAPRTSRSSTPPCTRRRYRRA